MTEPTFARRCFQDAGKPVFKRNRKGSRKWNPPPAGEDPGDRAANGIALPFISTASYPTFIESDDDTDYETDPTDVSGEVDYGVDLMDIDTDDRTKVPDSFHTAFLYLKTLNLRHNRINNSPEVCS
jgi:hypothetical protein